MIEKIEKIYFNIFPVDKGGKEGKEITYRLFKKGGGYEDVPADYTVSNPDSTAKGSGIKSKSQAGNPVIRLSIGVGSPAHYYRGTLVFNDQGKAALKEKREQPKGERSGVFGTLTDKEGAELEVAGWIRHTKEGKPYISCVAQEPMKKSEAPSPTQEEDIPF